LPLPPPSTCSDAAALVGADELAFALAALDEPAAPDEAEAGEEVPAALDPAALLAAAGELAPAELVDVALLPLEPPQPASASEPATVRAMRSGR
jgi:hypothetical protein